MRIGRIGALVLSILVSMINVDAGQVVLGPESKLWLVGDSTLHAYAATATNVKFEMESKSPPESLFEQIRAGGMEALNVRVPVRGLKSGKAQLDRNMHRALKADEHPEIIFHLLSYDVSPSTSATSFPLTAQGELFIAGQTKTVDLEATATKGEPLHIKGSEELLMTDYGINPPSFMGAIKTRNRVVINFNLFLDKN